MLKGYNNRLLVAEHNKTPKITCPVCGAIYPYKGTWKMNPKDTKWVHVNCENTTIKKVEEMNE